MAQSARTQAMTRRYGEAFVVARATNGIGKAIELIGIVLGASIVLASIVAINHPEKGLLQLGLVGIAFGVCIGVLFFLCGLIVAAQGQILKASLDSAVNSSPFLTDDERATVMSLPLAGTATDGPHALDGIQF